MLACNARDAEESKASQDKIPPAVTLKANFTLYHPTYHPILSVEVDDYYHKPDEEKFSSASDYVLSPNGGIKQQKRKEGEVFSIDRSSSDLAGVYLFENDQVVISRISLPNKELYSSDHFSVDLEHTNGEYTYLAKADDNAGNRGKSLSLTLVFKNGYAFPKDAMIKDKTPPKVTLTDDWDKGKLCVDIEEIEPNSTGILEATLLNGTEEISHYVASPDPEKGRHSLGNYLFSYEGREDSLCLTNLPHGTSKSLGFGIPSLETLAAVKDVVIVAKDFAGNETRIAYAQTEDFKELKEAVEDYQEIDKFNAENADILKRIRP